MTKEALKLALEALVMNNAEWKHLADSGDSGYWSAEDQNHYKQTEQAITAIKEALANEALDKMAENARELGLDYEPAQKPCGGCKGSGWVTRDPDIGTDQECFVCGGSGAYPKEPEHGWTPERIAGMARLKEAQDKKLAQPEQEPVACDCDSPSWCKQYKKCNRKMLGFMPYVAQPQRTWVNATTWRGLTEKDICEAAIKSQEGISPRDDTLRFAIAIEAKLKEKNT